MSEETVRLVERLRGRLRRTVRRLTLGELAFGLVTTLGTLAALWLVSAAVEAGLWMRPGPRSALVGAVGLAVLVLFGAFVARPLLRLAGLLEQPSDEEAARHVGRRFPEIADRFVNLLQLFQGGGPSGSAASGTSRPLTDRAVAHLGREVDEVAFEEVEDFSRVRRASRFAVVPVAGLLIFLLAAPNAFLGASGRLLAPTAHFQRPAPFQLAVSPGQADLVKGDSLAVTVRAAGQALPATVTLQAQAAGEEHVEDFTLAPSDSGDGRFRHVFTGVRKGFRYRATAEGGGRTIRTGWHTARVAERPRVGRLQVRLSPPAYSGLPDRTLAPGTGDVTALPGTEVSIEAALAGPAAQEALLHFADGRTDTLALEGGTASGTFTLREEGTYHLGLRSARGAPNADPIRYRLRLTSDAAPTVSLTAPAPEAALTDALRPTLRWQMSDDYGFATQKLYWRLAERRHGEAMDEFQAIDLPVDRPRMLDQEVAYDWLIRQKTNLDLVPGDVLEYYVRVWDNNRVAGYQSARTATHRLRLPSMAEKYEALGERQAGIEEQMERLEQDQQDLEQQFEGLRDELRRKREGNWEDQRQVEQLQQRQQQLEEGAQRLARQIEQAARQMQEGQLTSPETQRMYEELKQVAREINSPELQKTLEKLQQAMQEMDMQKMQQALKNFEFNEEQYRERLKRTKELFEKIKVQQKLEEAARRAGELAEEERRLAEATKQLEEERSGARGSEKESEAKPGEKKPAEDAADEKQAANEKADEEEASAEKLGAQGERPERQAGEQSSGEKTPGEKTPGEETSEKESSGEEASARQQGQRDQSGQASRSEEERERLAQVQERARQKMKKLQEEMQKLSEDMQGMRGAPRKQMQQMQRQMQRQQMQRQMQQNSQQLRQGQLQKARQGQQQMQQSLQQMQQSLQQMQQGMQGQQRKMNMAGLRQALERTLTLSEDQETLRRETAGLDAGSPALREVTRRQSELADGLRATSDSLVALARQIPKMTRAVQKETGEALRAMQQATDAMTGRTTRQAGGHQKEAMKNLNELALLLSQLLQQMQQQGGQGSGMSAQQMMQQLQQMAGQQKKLNGQVQQMLNDMQGDRLSQEQGQRLKQMAQQQRAIQKQLQQLQKEGADGKALGDLQKMAEQMGETISEMRQQRLNRETLERQQQILSRLLQAQQSLQKRGREEQRRGREADGDYTRERPADTAAPGEEAQQLRRALIRSLESGYTPDYEQLIKRYFELLQEQQRSGRTGNSGPEEPDEAPAPQP